MQIEQPFAGIWKITLGEPETATPVALRHKAPQAAALATQATPADIPFELDQIHGRKTSRGYVLTLPLAVDEQLYGFGLQLLSFNQRDAKKTLRVNSDPKADLGDSHAPVPFYVSTRGYGVLVDTARYATFYTGTAQPRHDRRAESVTATSSRVIFTAQDLYETRRDARNEQVTVEIPHAAGATLYLFAGPSLLDAVQRYNLFSGGGCLPPRWGLGVWYRCRADFDQALVQQFAADFRHDGIPCDVLGLEPGWQTHSYSCSFLWSDKFPQPEQMARNLLAQHYRLNLWTHAFAHVTSPIYGDLLPHSGDHEVWQGLVPDLADSKARHILGQCFEQQHIGLGVSGYKLDECDNSDFIAPPWSFPEVSQFPSGLDGEQTHSLFGLNFQETVDAVYRRRNQRAYHGVRSSQALAAPYPFVLYSDLYDHADFVRGVVNCGFSGLLWSPEVRHAQSAEELIRRLQTVVLSPQALINAWYIKNPPWKQWDTPQNNADVLAPNWTEVSAMCRDVLALRMQLIPYLYSAFYAYQQHGTPPFRALVMDYPDDANTWKIDNQYLMGDRIMVAPVLVGMSERAVYLPAGEWVDFWTNEAYSGGQTIRVQAPLTTIPMFVKAGALLPLAIPTLHTDDPASFDLRVRVYGAGHLPIHLYEDDGATFAYEQGAYNRVTLSWDAHSGQGSLRREGDGDYPRYSVREWQV
jgi:alpha-D-xyloside xylohydrolase